MKKCIYTLLALISICTSASAQIVMGDMNNDGKLTMEDVTSSINTMLGKESSTTISTYSISNQAVEGTWWKSRTESITFNTDKTTDYAADYTYYYIPELHVILLRNQAELPVKLIDAQIIHEDTLKLQNGSTEEIYFKQRPPQLATGITLSSSSLTIISGQTETLIATVSPEDTTNPSVTWSSSDESVATVSNEGVVTAVSRGTATITATTTDGSGVSATCQVTVPLLVSDITLSATELSMLEKETKTLTATVSPTDADNTSVVWTSSDESVATVSNAGLVTAVGAGTATITATAVDGGGAKAECSVTVEKLIPITEVVFSKTETSIELGKEETITVTVSPDDAQHKTLTWKSSNERIATVDQNGVIHAQGIGTATITATSADEPTVSATCAVTVTGTYRMYFGHEPYNEQTFIIGSYTSNGVVSDDDYSNKRYAYVDLQNILWEVKEINAKDYFTIGLRLFGIDQPSLGLYADDTVPVYVLIPHGISTSMPMRIMWNDDIYQIPWLDTYTINGIMYDYYCIGDSYQFTKKDCPTVQLRTFSY